MLLPGRSRPDGVPGWRFQGEPFTITTSDGAELSGERAGLGPTVVLCHCWTGDRSIWEPVAARLAADHHVVVFDQRGHGQSTLGTVAPSISRLGDDLADLIGQLELDAPVVAGHSLGGMGLLALASVSPRLLSAMVLVSTSAAPAGLRLPPALATRGLAAFIGAPMGDSVISGPAGRLVARASLGLRPPRQALDRTVNCLRATPPSVRRAQMLEIGAFDLRPRLSALAVPATIAVGSLDALTPVAHARQLHAALAGSTLTVLPWAGHMLPLERSDAVADLIAVTVRTEVRAS